MNKSAQKVKLFRTPEKKAKPVRAPKKVLHHRKQKEPEPKVRTRVPSTRDYTPANSVRVHRRAKQKDRVIGTIPLCLPQTQNS